MTEFEEANVRGLQNRNRRIGCLHRILAVAAAFAGPALTQPSPLFYRTDYKLNNATSPYSTGIVIADFNNDGKVDVAIGAGYGIDVALGNGDGTLQPFTSFLPTGGGLNPGWAMASAAADFDGDGKIDLVLYSGNGIVILPGKGDGTFGLRQILSQPSGLASGLAPGPYPELLETADLNHDGHPDLVLLTYNGAYPLTASVTLLLNSGNGTFSSRTLNLPSFEYAVGVAIADFNRDGAPDLAVIGQPIGPGFFPSGVNGHVYVGFGKGDGSFSPLVAVSALSATPRFVATADFNRDGAPDLAVQSSTTIILLNNGDGSFRAAPNINLLGANPGSIAVADWTGSGNPGVGIFTPLSPQGVGIEAGNGDGTFYSAGTAAVDPSAAVLTFSTADLNGDGRPDLVVLVGLNVSVLLNAGNSPGLNFVAASSASGIESVAPASIATIYAAFGSPPPPGSPPLPLVGATVNVRDSTGVTRPAPQFFSSTTQINLEIPAGTAPGVATVTAGTANGPSFLGSALVRNVVPAIFTAQSSGQGFVLPAAYAITYGPDGEVQSSLLVTECQSTGCTAVPIPRPPGSRVFLELFATGIRNHVSPVVVSLTGQMAAVQNVAPAYAGPQGQFEGLDQVNVEITNLPALPSPPMAPPGSGYILVLNVDGLISNTVRFGVQ